MFDEVRRKIPDDILTQPQDRDERAGSVAVRVDDGVRLIQLMGGEGVQVIASQIFMFSPGPFAQHAIMKAQAMRNFLLPETVAGCCLAGSSPVDGCYGGQSSRAKPIDPSFHQLRVWSVSSKHPNKFTADLSCEKHAPDATLLPGEHESRQLKKCRSLNIARK
jgi:hypothetical protein